MFRFRAIRSLTIAGLAFATTLAGTPPVHAQQYDQPQSYDQSQPYDNSDQSPGRVARLAYLSGQVQFSPAGENDWGSVDINRPLVIGDRLLTGDDGLAALELGDSSIRIDHDTAFDFLNLTDSNVQVELSQGTLNMAVRQINDGENFEVDTPTIAFVATSPGVYRIDDSPTGTGSMVTVLRGAGIVYGENGASRPVNAGSSYRFDDSTLTSVEVNGLPERDDFDRFCEARDARYDNVVRRDYVPPEMIGGDDLYQYGQWDDTPDYGNVWYPTAVPVGWAPYRYGHWAWIDPWGWTWIDDEPWGFAPFHYGRWAYIGDRWGWIPGPVNVRPYYAPALVAFIGGAGFSLSISIGGGGPVGWFPLGPRDVYVPWYHASRNYFNNVNITNIRNVYVNKTIINNIYNDYSSNRVTDITRYNRYTYRNMPAAVTAVPRNVFVDARPVRPAVLRLNSAQLARAQVATGPHVMPAATSLGVRNPTARPAVLHVAQPFAKPVVARHAPPPAPAPFAARERVIASQQGRPLTPAQMASLRPAQPAAQRSERVRLVPAVAAAAAGAAAIGAMHHAAPRPAEPAAPSRVTPVRPGAVAGQPAQPGAQAPFKNTVHPIPAPGQPAREAPLHPGELPSARFAHPQGTLPRAPVIRPAEPSQGRSAPETQRENPFRPAAPQSGPLPAVRPVERTQPPANNPQPEIRAQQQRQAEMQAQQRAAEQQQQMRIQEQRQAEMQAQQQRAAAMQREQQMQQQRAAEMQREQSLRQRAVQAPQGHYYAPPRGQPRPAPQRNEPSRKPPPSSDNGHSRR